MENTRRKAKKHERDACWEVTENCREKASEERDKNFRGSSGKPSTSDKRKDTSEILQPGVCTYTRLEEISSESYANAHQAKMSL